VHFTCGNRIDIDINPVKRHFYAACNSILAKSRGAEEPVRVQLIKSYCLPLLVYCIGALHMTRTSVQQLSVCWNDAFRRIFHYKRFESVKCLQDAFGAMDINHMYDLHRWNFLKSLHKRCDSWLNFIVIHDLEFHICDNLKRQYMNEEKFLRFSDCVVSHFHVIATM